MPIPPYPYHASLESRAMIQYLLALRVNEVCIDTSVSAQSVELAKLDGQRLIIKDVSGNAAANPITVVGTVEGVLNPTIDTDYGTLLIFAYNGAWYRWCCGDGDGGDGITELTGDVTAIGPGVAVATLATTAVTPGSYGDATHVGQFTVDSKGRLTAAVNVPITDTDTGITQLTGDVTAGPGSGSQAATLANTAVTPATYGDATHVSQITVDSKGRITSAVDVAISGSGGSSWIPLSLGVEPLTFVSDGAGSPILIPYTP